MSKRKIGIGYRVGMLTVTAPTTERESGYTVWRCRCDCGGELLLDTRALYRGTIRNCGCKPKLPPGSKDLTGQRFGKLTVQYATEKRADRGSVVWHCLCDCGNECEVTARRLIRGKVRSCGCLSNPPLKDYIGKTFGRLTVIEYAGTAKELGYATGKARFWKCRCSCGNETTVSQTELQAGGTQSCGCLVKEKLRDSLILMEDTSVAILERNKTHLRSDNVSGKTGVSWDSRTQCWAANITFKKKHYRLGRYKDKADAIRVRTEAEAMYDDFLNWYYEIYMQRGEKDTDGTISEKKMDRIQP